MANTGHEWGAFAYVKHSTGSDWDGTGNALIANSGSLISDNINLNQKSAILLGFTFIEDNTGDITGDMTISILSAVGGGSYEVTATGKPFLVDFTPVRNASAFFALPIDPAAYYEFEVKVENNSGQEIGVKLYIQSASIPLAT